MKSTMGSSAAPAMRLWPIRMPVGTAIAAASAKAPQTRSVETPACQSSARSRIICQSVAATTEGAGRNRSEVTPDRAAASQPAKSARTASAPTTARIEGRGNRRAGRPGAAARAASVTGSARVAVEEPVDQRGVDLPARVELHLRRAELEVELHDLVEEPVQRARLLRRAEEFERLLVGRVLHRALDDLGDLLRRQAVMRRGEFGEALRLGVVEVHRAVDAAQELLELLRV